MSKKQNDELVQQKYIELQTLEQQFGQIKQQITNLELQLIELNKLNESLEDLEKVKKGSEILVPLGGGIFTRAEVKTGDELLMNVGSGVMVKKKREEAKKILSKQIKELEKIFTETEKQLNDIAMKLQSGQQELQGLVSEK